MSTEAIDAGSRAAEAQSSRESEAIAMFVIKATAKIPLYVSQVQPFRFMHPDHALRFDNEADAREAMRVVSASCKFTLRVVPTDADGMVVTNEGHDTRSKQQLPSAGAVIKVLVCGSRDWTDGGLIREWLAKFPPGTIVVHGAARGADDLAGEVADALGFEVRRYPADWQKNGNAAGPLRNQQMLDVERPDVVFAFTHALRREDRPERNTGTGDMVVRAVAAGVRCTIIPPRRLDAQSLLAPAREA